jgi:hypothetical protein
MMIILILSMSLVINHSITPKQSSHSFAQVGDAEEAKNKAEEAEEAEEAKNKAEEAEEVEDLIPSESFFIVGSTGLCASARKPGYGLYQALCTPKQDTLWKAEKKGNGFIFKNQYGNVIDNKNDGTKNGNPVIGNYSKNTSSQIWNIEKYGDSWVRIRNIKANKCLDGTGYKRIGQQYDVWDCIPSTNLNYRLLTPTEYQTLYYKKPPVAKVETKADPLNDPNQNYAIRGSTGLCVFQNNGEIQQQRCSSYRPMMWNIIKYGKGFIIRSGFGKVLDLQKGTPSNSTKIIVSDRNNSDSQIWTFEKLDDSNYRIRNIYAKKCLNDTGRKYPGRFYQLWDCVSSPNLTYTLKKL